MTDWLIYIVGALDSLPNGGRAMLSAAVLAVFLYQISTRIAPYYLGLHTSFRKASLIALVLIPIVVYNVLDLRILILVPELPTITQTPEYIWQPFLALWLIGVGYQLIRMRRTWPEPLSQLKPIDAQMQMRFDFWARKLNLKQSVTIGIGSGAAPTLRGWLRPCVFIPPASARWSAQVQDVMLIHALCLIRKDTRLWHAIGQAVAALYWPLPWVRQLSMSLNTTLAASVHAMAQACFHDDFTYRRAFRQIGDHLAPEPDPCPEDTDIDLGQRHLVKLSSMRTDYILETLRRDPKYDRVFWALVPAALAVFILTNTTLAEIRDRPEMIDLAPAWTLSFTNDGLYRTSIDAQRDERH